MALVTLISQKQTVPGVPGEQRVRYLSERNPRQKSFQKQKTLNRPFLKIPTFVVDAEKEMERMSSERWRQLKQSRTPNATTRKSDVRLADYGVTFE